jgi:hypothetical protein
MSEGNLVPRQGGFMSDKILRQHRERLAMVYIRQSTVHSKDRVPDPANSKK